MKKNLGRFHTAIRYVLAVVCAYLYFGGIVTGTWGIIMLLLAGLYLFTAITSYAPLYGIFNKSTRRVRDENDKS